MAERTYWATLLTIIEAGLEGDQAKVRAYTELLEQNIRKDGDERLAERLERILTGQAQRNTLGFEPWFGKPDYFTKQGKKEGEA